LPGAISSVADDSAVSVLAGVNPVHDLYASFDGPIAGGSRQHPTDGDDEDERAGVAAGSALKASQRNNGPATRSFLPCSPA
jgi:SulP family sulfate permease